MARVAGGLAYASLRNQDRVGLVTFTDRVESVLVPRRSRGHVWAVIEAVYRGDAQGRGTSLVEAIRFVRSVQRRRAVVVLVSDFFDPGAWDQPLGSLARRHKVHAVCVHDPLDGGLPGLGLVEVVDAETGRRRLVDGSRLRRPPLADRLTRLTRTGARVVPLSTADDPFAVLLHHFHREGVRR
jgi:uncharacterized protein (DUF58 family)